MQYIGSVVILQYGFMAPPRFSNTILLWGKHNIKISTLNNIFFNLFLQNAIINHLSKCLNTLLLPKAKVYQ